MLKVNIRGKDVLPDSEAFLPKNKDYGEDSNQQNEFAEEDLQYCR